MKFTKDYSACIDIGSSKIVAILGEKGINNTFIIRAYSELNYSGFSEGEFFDASELESVVLKSIENIRLRSKAELSEIYIGCPGEFTSAVSKHHQLSFIKKHKINAADVKDLFDNANTNTDKNYILINKSPIYYYTDDKRKIINPLGILSSSLGGFLSYIFAEKYFIDAISNIFKKTGYKFSFISSALAQALFLFEEEERDRIILLCDIGYISSSVMLVQGDGLIFLKSFSMGGGHITAKITQDYKIPFAAAENIKRLVNLSLDLRESGGNYDIVYDEKNYNLAKKEVNESVISVTDAICELIEGSLNEFSVNIPQNLTLYLTGGGVCYMRGAKELISKRLNRVTEIIKPNAPLLKKPTAGSFLGLLSLTLYK